MSAATDTGWMNGALCAQVGGDAFFPETGESPRTAQRVCRACPVRAACLEYALATRQRSGVWGGLSRTERLAVLAARQARETAGAVLA